MLSILTVPVIVVILSCQFLACNYMNNAKHSHSASHRGHFVLLIFSMQLYEQC